MNITKFSLSKSAQTKLVFLILFLGLTVFSLITIRGVRDQEKATRKIYEEQKDSLLAEIDSWKDICTKNTLEYVTAQNEYNSEINQLKSNLSATKKAYQKKILEVQQYSNVEVQQFFTDRYPKVGQDTSKFLLYTETGQSAIVDLLEHDALEENSVYQDSIIYLQSARLKLADSSIISLSTGYNYYKSNLETATITLDKSKALNGYLVQDLKHSRNLNKVLGVSVGVTAVALVLSLILGGK